MTGADPRAQSQARFTRYAHEYVVSAAHAGGDDLERLLELAAPAPDGLALDIATGGGHTALKIAPHVGQVIAADLTAAMLHEARSFIAAKGAANVAYTRCDAEALPYPAETFDLVTCRIAPHHFPHVERFVDEAARVLKPGGRLVVQDQVAPDDRRAARYVDAFERLRDPSHHHTYAAYQWEGMFLNSGLAVEAVEIFRKSTRLLWWAGVQACSAEVIDHLQILLAQAPQAVAEHLRPACAGTPDATFDHVYVLIAGSKPRGH